ncbi:MAG: hypothetical protein K0S66_2247, partial [Sphingomonas sp.]|nr:hypothetical protein [Sphingomonas sp.]
EPKTSRTARALVKDDKHPGYGQTGKAALTPRLRSKRDSLRTK